MITPSLRVLATNLDRLRCIPGNPSTQTEIAALAGIDQSTVGRILAQRNSPTIERLDGLAHAFGVRPWQLLVPGMDFGRQQEAKLGPLALELARLYELLPPHRQTALYAVAEAMHNPAPAASGVAPTEDAPARPAGQTEARPADEPSRGLPWGP